MPTPLPRTLTNLAKILLHLGWAAALLFLALTGHVVLSGLAANGPMAMAYALFLYLLAALPVALLTPLALHLRLGQGLARTAAYLLLAIALWWVFWLPASLLDVAYTQRYHIRDPYVWPAPAASQVIVVASAAWLLSARRLNSWQATAIRLLAYGLASTVFAWVGATFADWARQDFALWLLIPCAAPMLLYARPPKTLLALPTWHELRLFLATQSALVMLWILIYRFGDQLPDSVNAFGAAIIYR